MDNQTIKVDSESVSIQTHLGIIQNVIQRMSANSSNCKAWCVSLVAAILVIVADIDKPPEYAWIALLPTIVFTSLDAYYLALEKGFRNSYDKFIIKIHKQQLTEKDLYSVVPSGNSLELQLSAYKSISVWGFYIPLLALIAITKWIALG